MGGMKGGEKDTFLCTSEYRGCPTEGLLLPCSWKSPLPTRGGDAIRPEDTRNDSNRDARSPSIRIAAVGGGVMYAWPNWVLRCFSITPSLPCCLVSGSENTKAPKSFSWIFFSPRSLPKSGEDRGDRLPLFLSFSSRVVLLVDDARCPPARIQKGTKAVEEEEEEEGWEEEGFSLSCRSSGRPASLLSIPFGSDSSCEETT